MSNLADMLEQEADEITCYASTTTEHRPNRTAKMLRNAAKELRRLAVRPEERDNYKRNPKADPCQCKRLEIPAGVDGCNWYWQYHTRTKCTVELPDLTCWCGLKRSEHNTGHDINVEPPSSVVSPQKTT